MTDLSRRAFLGRGAAVTAAVWVTPTIVSASRASAAVRHSEPPHHASKPPVYLSPVPPIENAPMGQPLAPGITGQLAFTGDAPEKDLAVGVGALVAGAALVVKYRTPRRLT